MTKNGYNVLFIIGTILGLAYFIYVGIIFYAMSGVIDMGMGEFAETIFKIGALQILPFFIGIGISFLLSVIAMFIRNKWVGLSAAILYTISPFLMFYLFNIFTFILAVIMYVGFGIQAYYQARQKQLELQN